jgi:regulator of sirC expression with transglutaminase-like and TPR domain
MDQTGVIAGSTQLPESQKTALLKLLADDDLDVYQSIRQRILSLGPAAAEWLQPHLLDRDPVLRRRTQEIVRHFERRAADDAFLAFCLKHGEEFDLEQASWLLAQTRYPEINPEAYRALLDSYAADVTERLATAGSAPAKVLVTLNRYLFEELGFRGNEENYYDPDNSYLNRVLDRRTGNPINLCLVYLVIARRLKLPLAGIGLPGHFICRYQSSAAEIYVDAFNRGKFLNKADCVQYLLQANYSVRDDYLSPVSPRRMLLRICGNLHQIYQNLRQTEAATRLQRYLVVLAR